MNMTSNIIQGTTEMTANLSNKQWIWQQTYSFYNEYDSNTFNEYLIRQQPFSMNSTEKCFQKTLNMTANVSNQQWIRQQMYSRNSEYDSKYIQGKIYMTAFNEQFNEHDTKFIRYSTNNEYASNCIQRRIIMTANASNEQFNKHDTKFMYSSNIMANVFNEHWIWQQMYSIVNVNDSNCIHLQWICH